MPNSLRFATPLFCLLLACCQGCGTKPAEVDLSVLADLEKELAQGPAGATAAEPTSLSTRKQQRTLDLEKDALKLGFIKLTDCAPIVIAKEKGFFGDEGLQVEVIAQPNWQTLLDNVISGELDGAHMLSGQPIAATIGIGKQEDIFTAFTMDLNGNAVTVSNAIWEQMQENEPRLKQPRPEHPISADSLRPIVEDMLAAGQKLQMGMVFPVSTHNYELRYWLAASGINPGMYSPSDIAGRTDAQVELSVTPPPMMPATLEAGNIQGYCVGEPWNQQAVAKGIGVPVTTNYDIWKNNPEKVFGVSKRWSDENPNTHVAVVKALIRAGQWLDAVDPSGDLVNREEAARILSRPDYVGADFAVIKNSMTGHFYFQKSDKRAMPDFNVFYKHHCTYPWYSDGVWFLTQMRRWGQIAEPKPAQWYEETARKVYKPEVYLKAARILADQGLIQEADVPWETDGYKPPTDEFIDGVTYDGRKPLEYLKAHQIGNQD
ncbi:Bicarbonate transport ATP-binding protein CmpC [Pirellulimonas nuda]|uniref:Bicarbonate transport ATP-binding protein CmpC n=1 Tax=Pirellulimonas nuda TaxID=2528009 RepID=A0A518DG53_9BACT|nr:CmpA/NrtA family ABC transporter substrate-binding protein [Pirellulimonas nuda]QDU90448.1 Bicarbonate transport ATP-binding protein CmpC [Pirellulimonas nuda]